MKNILIATTGGFLALLVLLGGVYFKPFLNPRIGPPPVEPAESSLPAEETQPYFLSSTAGNTLTTVEPMGQGKSIKIAVNNKNGNPWQQIGSWKGIAKGDAQLLSALGDFHGWLGLANSGAQGLKADLRAEIYKNGSLVTTGTTYCAQGLTRNPKKAKEIIVSFDSFPPLLFEDGDTFELTLLARVGTPGPGGSLCPGHRSGPLFFYYDSMSWPSRFGTSLDVWAQLTGPYSLTFPPNWQMSTASSPFPDLDASLSAITITSPAGSNFIVFPKGGYDYGLTEVQETTAPIEVAGFHGVRRDFRLANGTLVLVRIELGDVPNSPEFRAEFRVKDQQDLPELESILQAFMISQ